MATLIAPILRLPRSSAPRPVLAAVGEVSQKASSAATGQVPSYSRIANVTENLKRVWWLMFGAPWPRGWTAHRVTDIEGIIEDVHYGPEQPVYGLTVYARKEVVIHDAIWLEHVKCIEVVTHELIHLRWRDLAHGTLFEHLTWHFAEALAMRSALLANMDAAVAQAVSREKSK